MVQSFGATVESITVLKEPGMTETDSKNKAQ